MKNIYSFLAFFTLATTYTNAQVSIDVDPPTGCFSSTYTLHADVSGAFGTESYTFANIPYAPEAYAGTQVSLGDDAVSSALPIGFTFCFLGETYTQFYIGSNGWVSFSPGQTTAYTSATIPNTAANVPKNCIMGPWEDWHPGIGGAVRYQTLGTAPNRRLVVSWQNVPMFSCTTTLGSFQIVIHETTGLIENHLTNKPNCPAWAGGTGTQGVHNNAGTIAFVAPGRNSTQWTTTNESTAFVPSGVVWFEGGNIIGYGDSIQVTPTQPTTYQVQVSLCDGNSYMDEVTLSPAPQFSTTNIQPSCNGEDDGSLTALVDGVVNETDYSYTWNPSGQTGATAVGLTAGNYVVSVSGPNNCEQDLNVTLGQPNVINVNVNTGLDCNNSGTGSAQFVASGGAGGFQYSIDGGNTFTSLINMPNLFSGSYTVLVVDANGCERTQNFTIGNSISPEITDLTVVSPSCASSDGEIVIMAVGGDAPFQYSINSGANFQTGSTFSNLGVGTYPIVVSNSTGCSSDTTVTLINPDSPIFEDVNVTNPSCGQIDGQIEIVLSGGTAPYNYSIDNGASFQPNNVFTGLSGTNYQIVVTDATGCISTTQVSLIPGTLPQIFLVDVNQPACPGDSGCVLIDAFGGIAPLTYSFDNGLTYSAVFDTCGILPGDYEFMVMGANGCAITYNQSIVVQDSVIAAISANPLTGQAPLDVQFENNSVNATNFYWDFGNGATSFEENPLYIFDPKGTYTVILYADNGNCFDSDTITIIVEADSFIQIPNVFTPNGDGANDFFQLQSHMGLTDFTFAITNRWGNTIEVFTTPDFQWDGGNQPEGVYFYRVTAAGNDGQEYDLHGFFQLVRD